MPLFTAVADPDLQIREAGGGHPYTEIRGEAGLQKNFFSALRASVWSKTKEGPSTKSATVEFTCAQKGSVLKFAH